jgi:general secretion pathway protein G
MTSTAPRTDDRGFTLVELLIAISVLAILASIAVTNVRSALVVVRTQKAVQEIHLVEREITMFRLTNGDLLPTDLAEIGREILRDPWGHPYVYTPFLPTTSSPSGQPGHGNGNGNGGGNGGGGGNGYGNGNGGGNGGGPPAPPGTIGQARKSRFLVPINSDFDLFSPGPDGDWVGPLTAQKSQDDIIRANNGDFVGPAWKD